MATDGLSTFTPQYAIRTSKVRVAELATRQCGRVSRAQLRALDVPDSTVDRWISDGYLIRVLPRVYAVGHAGADQPTRLFELVLFAGPGAAISHGTAAHWRGWLRFPVEKSHVSTPRRIRTRLRKVEVHSARTLDRELVNGIPCTTVTRTLLDLAASEPLSLVRRSLAQLDYERALRPEAIRAACGYGRRGSSRLLEALDTYIPAMAATKSDLEIAFLLVCRRHGLPIPNVNTIVHGVEVDCHWPQYGLVVELDGGGNHATAAQRNRDQGRDMKLRAHGLTVIRYTNDQVTRSPQNVADDIHAEVARRASNILH